MSKLRIPKRKSCQKIPIRQRLLFEWGYRRLAETCRRRKLPYPRLGPEGELLEPLPGKH